jgi:hypothetical protein
MMPRFVVTSAISGSSPGVSDARNAATVRGWSSVSRNPMAARYDWKVVARIDSERQRLATQYEEAPEGSQIRKDLFRKIRDLTIMMDRVINQ